MAVIIRNVPPTYNWGWFSREDPRMHVQTVDRVHLHLNYKIWLEREGDGSSNLNRESHPKYFRHFRR